MAVSRKKVSGLTFGVYFLGVFMNVLDFVTVNFEKKTTDTRFSCGQTIDVYL